MKLRAISRSGLAVTLITCLSTTGLAKPPRWEKSASVRWADDAGSVTVAPIAVMPWDEAAAILQPKFTMTAEQAYAQAIPTSQSEDVRLAYILNAALRLGLPTTSITTTTTQEGETDPLAISRKRVTERKSGTLDGVEAPDLVGRTADALGGLTPPAQFDRDPMLRHLAATALYQEVQLLNRYVTDAVRFRGAQAFLVRLQLSVLPSRRSLPYDVTTDITIHPSDMMAHARLAQGRDDDQELKDATWKENPAERTRDEQRAGKEKAEREVRKAAALQYALRNRRPGETDQAITDRINLIYERPGFDERSHRRCSTRWDTVHVMPMVVTDNMEGIAASRSTDSATQLGLALMGTIANVGLGGEFGETREAIRRAQGRDTNSLLTVARLTDDTVRIRLGAAESPSLGNTLLPRTHNISLVVIYRPCDPEAIHSAGEERMLTAVTKASFTDVFTGRTLPYQPAADRLVDMTVGLNRKYNNRFSYLEYAHLYRLVSSQDREGFRDFFAKKLRLAQSRNEGRPPKKRCDGLSREFAWQDKFAYLLKHGSRAKDIEPRPEDNALLNYLYEEDRPEKDDDGRFKELDGTGIGQSNECLREVLAYDVAPNALWTDLQSLRPFGEYSYANIPLVLHKVVPQLPPAEQTAVLTHNDAGGSVTLYQGRHLSGIRDVTAMLRVDATVAPAAEKNKPKPKPVSTPLVIPAASVAPSADGRALTIKFPPFTKIDVGKGEVTYTAAGLDLNVGRMEDGRALRPGTQLTYSGIKLVADKPAAAPKPDFELAAPASAIVAGADGKARFSVFVKKSKADTKAGKLRLTLDGAEVAAVSGATTSTDGGWSLAGPGTVSFTLEGLMPGQNVKLGLMGTADGKESEVATPIVRPVFALAGAKKE